MTAAQSVNLYDADGNHLRTCPLGALQALETLHQCPRYSAASLRLSSDQLTIWGRFPDSETDYSWLVRPVGEPVGQTGKVV
jgi:hypothetical protein